MCIMVLPFQITIRILINSEINYFIEHRKYVLTRKTMFMGYLVTNMARLPPEQV